jgi:uncharacterized membrane protein
MLVLCFLTGPFEVADEPAHYMRMVSVAEGHWLPVVSPPQAPKKAAGTYEDVAVAQLAARYQDNVGWAMKRHSIQELRQKGAVGESGTVAFAPHAASIYPPFLYFVASAATVAARALDLPPLSWLYLGRLANALMAIFVIQAALRRADDASLGLFACAMLPMNLYQSASVSADALLIPLTTLSMVLLLRVARGEPVGKGQSWALAVSTVVVCAGKVAYLPFCLLPPLAMRLVDKRWSARAAWSVLVAGVTVALWLAWAVIVHDKIFSIRPNVDIDPAGQLGRLVRDPIASALFFAHWMAVLSPKLVIGAVGSQLGWGDLRLPWWLIYPLPFLLVAAAFPSERPRRRLIPLTVTAAVVGLACYCAVFLLLYLQYNEVGAPFIDGVQGRYFMPIVVLFLALSPKFKVSASRMSSIWAGAAIIALTSSAVTLVMVLHRYW